MEIEGERLSHRILAEEEKAKKSGTKRDGRLRNNWGRKWEQRKVEKKNASTHGTRKGRKTDNSTQKNHMSSEIQRNSICAGQ